MDTSVEDGLAGSLAECRDAHQHGAAHEQPAALVSLA
jgi:hypothetical protein